MRSYTVAGPNASGTGPATCVNVIAATTVRPRVSELIIGDGTQVPVNQMAIVQLNRCTGVGTTAATPPTPTPVDPADVACVSTTGWTHSAEPTGKTEVLRIPINLQATYRWIASPGKEIVCPATANNNIAATLLSTTNATSAVMNAVIEFEE